MYRKLKTLFILIMMSALLLTSCFVSTAAALETPIKILIDGKTLKSDTAPLNSGGRVLVPFRAIFEALGSGAIISGAVVLDGKYAAAGGVLKLTDVKESWYPDPTKSGQTKAYKNKSVDGGAYSYEFEEIESKLRLRDQETSLPELFYRVVEGQ